MKILIFQIQEREFSNWEKAGAGLGAKEDIVVKILVYQSNSLGPAIFAERHPILCLMSALYILLNSRCSRYPQLDKQWFSLGCVFAFSI